MAEDQFYCVIFLMQQNIIQLFCHRSDHGLSCHDSLAFVIVRLDRTIQSAPLDHPVKPDDDNEAWSERLPFPQPLKKIPFRR